MSPDVERSEEVLAVVDRYHRRERLASGLVVAAALAAFLGTYVATSLLPAAAVAAVLVVVARAPVLRSQGTVRLRTDAPVDDVADAFAGPTPPVLAFQWGLADEITPAGASVTYRLSYLLGLRSVEMTVDTDRQAGPGADTGQQAGPSAGTDRQAEPGADTDQRAEAEGYRRVELDITAGGGPWGSYTAQIRPDDGGTVVDVEYESDRRFGLRRLPQQLLARRHRDELLAAQGYAVVERDSYHGV